MGIDLIIWQFITGWVGDYSITKWFSIAQWFIDSFILYFLFAWISTIDVWTRDFTGWKRKVFRWPFVITLLPIGYLRDIKFNFTYGNLMFLEWPKLTKLRKDFTWSNLIKEMTLTARLKRHLAGPRETKLDKYRYYQAKGWCWLIEKWAPGHCK